MSDDIVDIDVNTDVDFHLSTQGLSVGTNVDDGEISYRAGLSEHSNPELFGRYTGDNIFADVGIIELESGDYRLNPGMTFNGDNFGIDSFDQADFGARANFSPDLIPDVRSEFTANAGATMDGNPVAYAQGAFEADNVNGSQWDLFAEGGAGYDPEAGMRADILMGAERYFVNDSGVVNSRFTTGIEGTIQNESGVRLSAEYDRRLDVTGVSEDSNLSAVFRGEVFSVAGSWGAEFNAAFLKDFSLRGFEFRSGAEVEYNTENESTTAGLAFRAPF